MDRLSRHQGSIRPALKRISVWLIAAILLTFTLFTLSACYLAYVKGTIQRDSKSNLQELGRHISESLTNNIRSTNDVLENIAMVLSRYNLSSEDETIAFLKDQADYWGFHDIAYIDRDGISRHSNKVRDTLNRSLISEALKSGDTVYELLISDGQDSVIFVTPLSPQAREKTGILAVSGTYAVHNWDILMDINIFNHQAVTHVITDSGVVITRGREKETGEKYNFLDSLKQADFESGVTLDTFQDALRDGTSFQTSYRFEGTDYYLDCEPIGFSNWYLVFTVPAPIVNKAGVSMAGSVVIIGGGLTVVFLLVFLFFLIIQTRAKNALKRMAFQDEITGGANKHRFELDAHALLSEDGRKYILVYINILQFKILNRRLGKQEADHILCSLYRGMEHLITARECCGRLGADNFVLLLEETESGSVSPRLERFAREQSVQTTSSGNPCPIRLAFGLCEAPPGTSDLTQLIDQANFAMKTLTNNGESLLAVYDAAMMERTTRERELTERLLQKDVSREFSICLQPKVDLATGRVVGAEALARWNSPIYGFIPPGEFIPLAEKAGIICQIDWFAFEKVCQVLRSWEERGLPLVPVSFNLSKAQLALPDFLEHYQTVIERYQTPCRYLDFEFTESILYEDTGALKKAVSRIHEMGCLCSVDDFGFGYSSLGLLGQFEADTLKLDRSFFLRDTCPDSRNNQIVCNVIQLADCLGMQTVAEGVEDQEHVDMLRQFGCGCIQGFFFSRPLPIEEFEQFSQNYTEERVTVQPPASL